MNYKVRQYRPAYCTGFENSVYDNVEYDKILSLPFFENFKHTNFKEFKIEPYSGDELIISAYYEDGKHWVAGFALPENSKEISNNGDLLIDNWRYKNHIS